MQWFCYSYFLKCIHNAKTNHTCSSVGGALLLFVSSCDDALERGLPTLVAAVVDASSMRGLSWSGGGVFRFISRSLPGPDLSDAKDVRMGFDVRFGPTPGTTVFGSARFSVGLLRELPTDASDDSRERFNAAQAAS